MNNKIPINPNIDRLLPYFKGITDTVFLNTDFINKTDAVKITSLLSEYGIENEFDNFAAISKVIRIIDFIGKSRDDVYFHAKEFIDERIELNQYLQKTKKESIIGLKLPEKHFPIKIVFHSKNGKELSIESRTNIDSILFLLYENFLDFHNHDKKTKITSIRTKKIYLQNTIVNLVYYINNHTQYKALDNMKPTNVICDIIFDLLVISGCIEDYKSRSSGKSQYIRSIIQIKKRG